MNNEMIKIRSTFEKGFGQLDLTLEEVDEYIKKFKEFNFEQFSEENRNKAKDICNHQLSYLRQIKFAIEGKRPKKELSLNDMNKLLQGI